MWTANLQRYVGAHKHHVVSSGDICTQIGETLG